MQVNYHNFKKAFKGRSMVFVVEYKNKTYLVDNFIYLEEEKELRLVVVNGGEIRFNNVEESDFQIVNIYNK